ncbi:MAG: hypothetical protein JXR31_06530 [Prolixibacteraceae bacterium]|nr:hypothetical protein [Prolixibacteraceae bacterium]MBN2773886.1 hypothetical protein [Prolixibacteraceae bacterium]
MKHKIIFILITVLILGCDSAQKYNRDSILTELKNYPEARLTDIYKNFFQDAYGPGHLIPDTTSAGNYLSWELQQPEWTDTLKWQALGNNHDFYRINLSFVKEGTLPRSILLKGMVESVKCARNPEIETWKKEWESVLTTIDKMGIELPGFEEDKKVINELLSGGEVVMHHSDHYVETYNPHYRIVHKSVFERWKSTYLKK